MELKKIISVLYLYISQKMIQMVYLAQSTAMFKILNSCLLFCLKSQFSFCLEIKLVKGTENCRYRGCIQNEVINFTFSH
jgi:hypothetical protein